MLRRKEKKELEELRQWKMSKLEEDMSIMKKCINACANAIQMNEETLGKLKEKTKELENKKVEEEIDRMFG